VGGGGLGIKDLDKFGRALRMRWFWKHLLRLKDPIDKALFFNSTYISTENGEDTPFWDARWI
jgi:hypothetical protein